jgi:hypothetical protein
MNSSQIVSRRMAYVAYRDNGNSVLRRHRGQERIVLNASDNADLGWGLDFSDKLCHQYSVSESPVARYASLYIDLPLSRLSYTCNQRLEDDTYHHLWPGFYRGETTMV